jgi:hypothetical protein
MIMSEISRSESLKDNAKRAIDAIMEATDLDDDTKDEIFDELQDHIEEQQSILSEMDDEDEDNWNDDDPEGGF